MWVTEKLKRELVLLIEPEIYYPVDYTIKYDGTKVYEKTYLKGKDLTQNQVINLRLQNVI